MDGNVTCLTAPQNMLRSSNKQEPTPSKASKLQVNSGRSGVVSKGDVSCWICIDLADVRPETRLGENSRGLRLLQASVDPALRDVLGENAHNAVIDWGH